MQQAVRETRSTQQRSARDGYAKCVEVSKRVRWDIDRDVIRGRSFDFSRKFLPDGLSKVDSLEDREDEAPAAAAAPK